MHMEKHILIVDDSPTLRASVSFVLKQNGFSVTEADNGLAGLDRLKESKKQGVRFSLIISDVNMPKMNGLDFLKEVKSPASNFKFIPVVILTTEREERLKNIGRENGAAGWMVKPFQPNLLMAVVKKFVR